MWQGPKLRVPTVFDGDREALEQFKLECGLYMMANPDRFPDEKVKITFIISYIHGKKVQDWLQWMFNGIHYQKPGFPLTANSFFDMMDAQYGDPHKELTAQRKLEGIEQETTVDEYVVQFRCIAIATGYSETNLIHRYITGLKPHIRKACFSVRPLPVKFNDWVETSTNFQENFAMEAEY